MVGNFYTNSFTNFQNRVCFICYAHHWNCFVRHIFWVDLSLQSVILICFIFCSLGKIWSLCGLISDWIQSLDFPWGIIASVCLCLFSTQCAVLFPTLKISSIFPNKVNGVRKPLLIGFVETTIFLQGKFQTVKQSSVKLPPWEYLYYALEKFLYHSKQIDNMSTFSSFVKLISGLVKAQTRKRKKKTF